MARKRVAKKRIPKITQEQAAALVRRNWTHPGGALLTEAEAGYWASTFFSWCKYDFSTRPLQQRTRPVRPTADALDRFTMLERDWIRRTADRIPVRRRVV